MTETAIRTPQGERTRAMRLRLLEATVECLVELGWSGTTTTVVSRRAGVSRGAQLHHFPSKQALVVAAVEHLAELRREELRRHAEGLPDQDRIRVVLDLLAAQFVSPVFFAALELWVAARTDAGLRELVGPLERRIGRETHAYAVELLGIDEARGDNRQLVQATLDLVRGLGLAASLSDDTRRREAVLDSWATVLDHELVMS
jgi:AcrR family transcriptional regulator